MPGEGKPFSPGDSRARRPKGSPNRAIAAVREAIALFAQQNVGKLQEWLDATAEKNPEKAADLYLCALEYFTPNAGVGVVANDLQPEDFPEPKGPIRPRMNAGDWLKRLIVGTMASTAMSATVSRSIPSTTTRCTAPRPSPSRARRSRAAGTSGSRRLVYSRRLCRTGDSLLSKAIKALPFELVRANLNCSGTHVRFSNVVVRAQ
jgi:hypothetical protein